MNLTRLDALSRILEFYKLEPTDFQRNHHQADRTDRYSGSCQKPETTAQIRDPVTGRFKKTQPPSHPVPRPVQKNQAKPQSIPRPVKAATKVIKPQSQPKSVQPSSTSLPVQVSSKQSKTNQLLQASKNAPALKDVTVSAELAEATKKYNVYNSSTN